MITVWGFYISSYLTVRLLRKGEDFRYDAMWEKYGDHPLINTYIKDFFMQIMWGFLNIAPVFMIMVMKPEGPTWLAGLGIAIWLIGFICEVIADMQLNHFIKYEKEYQGHVMTKGIWKYSRHPNYFGEATMWWGYFIIALTLENGWMTFFGPVIITFILIYVTGIPLVERRSMKNPEYVEYAKNTSKFIPWFPRI